MHLRFWGSRVARRQCRKHKPFLNKPFYLVFGDFRCACQNQIESIGNVQGHIGIQQLVGNKTSAFDSQENAAPILSHPPLRQSRDRDMILSKGAALWKGHSKPKNRPICVGPGSWAGLLGTPQSFPSCAGRPIKSTVGAASPARPTTPSTRCAWSTPSPGKEEIMSNEKVFQMKLQKVYPLLVAKAEKKGRSRGEVDAAAC